MTSWLLAVVERRKDIADDLTHHQRNACAIFLLAISALGLRLLNPGPFPTGDEANTLLFVRRYTATELVWRVPIYQPHFPLYYLLLNGIEWATGQALDGRILSYIAGAAVPIPAYLWFRQLMEDWRAFMAAGLLAISPVLVAQSHWLRMYSLLTLAVLCSWWAAYRYLNNTGSSFAVIIPGFVVIGLHPLGIFAIGAQLLWLYLEGHFLDAKPRIRDVSLPLHFVQVVGVAILGARILLDTGAGAINSDSLHIMPAHNPVRRLFLLPITTLTGTLFKSAMLYSALTLSAWYAYQILKQRVWKTQVGRMALFWVCGSLAALYMAQLVRPVLMLKYVGWIAPGSALLLALSTPEDRRFHVALGILLGIILTNLLWAFTASGSVSMVAVWENGVMRRLH